MINQNFRKNLIKYDAILQISIGNNRKSKNWKLKKLSWSSLVERLSKTTFTSETMAEYLKMSKDRQDDIKDIGGFVGGILEGERRTASNIRNRQVVTLDADYAGTDFWEMVKMFCDFACCMYSTHKHTAEKPRLRLVIPLDREVSPDEYQAIARKIADCIDIEVFDDTTYEPHRLMYWPSTPSDCDFVFEYQDLPLLRADSVLGSYEDWTDQNSWPMSSRVSSHIKREIKKQADPLEKGGVIGAFCNSYSIDDTITEFLSDVYSPCGPNRYTFIQGSTSGGAVVYENKWLYSHHSTDPCTMTLVNAFDLVRIHRYGNLDLDITETDVTKLPSYEAMKKFASDDKKVRAYLIKERMEEAGRDFTDLGEEDDMTWTEKFQVNKKTGAPLNNRFNIRLILENDPAIKGTFGYDIFNGRTSILRAPLWRGKDNNDKVWTDADDAELRYLIETTYGIDARQKIDDEIMSVSKRNAFHCVRDYLRGLKWDKKERMERIFIDYLGADDTPYVRTVTRKMLIAAVARVFEPGCKFDNVVILEGPQGIGKSYLIKLLGKQWFSDSLTSMQGKEAFEQLRGYWIIEIGELAVLRRSEVDSVKQFITKQVDSYRQAYGRHTVEFPRQCIFVGTTNNTVFLKDQTGNRRFWPIRVHTKNPILWKDEIFEIVDQIWAEAYEAYSNKESLWIGSEIEAQARVVQESFSEENELLGMLTEFVQVPLPANWYYTNMEERKAYFKDKEFEVLDKEGMIKRTKICLMEIWCEMLGGDPKALSDAKRAQLRQTVEKLEGWKLYDNQGYHHKAFGKAYGRQKAYVLIGEEESD